MLNVFCPSVEGLGEAAFGPQNARVLTARMQAPIKKHQAYDPLHTMPLNCPFGLADNVDGL